MTPRRIFAAEVIAAVVRARGVSADQIIGQARHLDVVLARHFAMYLVRELCPHLSYPGIGRAFGGRDHSTVMHAVARIRRMAAADPDLAAELAALQQKVTAGEAPSPPSPPRGEGSPADSGSADCPLPTAHCPLPSSPEGRSR